MLTFFCVWKLLELNFLSRAFPRMMPKGLILNFYQGRKGNLLELNDKLEYFRKVLLLCCYYTQFRQAKKDSGKPRLAKKISISLTCKNLHFKLNFGLPFARC